MKSRDQGTPEKEHCIADHLLAIVLTLPGTACLQFAATPFKPPPNTPVTPLSNPPIPPVDVPHGSMTRLGKEWGNP